MSAQSSRAPSLSSLALPLLPLGGLWVFVQSFAPFFGEFGRLSSVDEHFGALLVDFIVKILVDVGVFDCADEDCLLSGLCVGFSN